MTTSMKDYPTRVPVKRDDKEGSVALDQIRTIDKQRIVDILDELSESEVKNLKQILKETYVD
jgi:mRNA interferase MazF